MKKVSSIDLFILSVLPEVGETLQAFTFFSRFRILPGTLSASAERLSRGQLITIEGDSIGITRKGVECRIKNRNLIQARKDLSWKKIPDEFLKPQLPQSVPYIPQRSQLDKKLL